MHRWTELTEGCRGVPEGGQHTQGQQGGLAQEVEPESGGTQPENALEPLRVSLEPGQMGSMLLPRRENLREDEALASHRTSLTQATNCLNGSAMVPSVPRIPA